MAEALDAKEEPALAGLKNRTIQMAVEAILLVKCQIGERRRGMVVQSLQYA